MNRSRGVLRRRYCIIAATAIAPGLKLVTADERLRRAPRLQAVWQRLRKFFSLSATGASDEPPEQPDRRRDGGLKQHAGSRAEGGLIHSIGFVSGLTLMLSLLRVSTTGLFG